MLSEESNYKCIVKSSVKIHDIILNVSHKQHFKTRKIYVRTSIFKLLIAPCTFNYVGVFKFRPSKVASGGFWGPRKLVPEMLMKIWSETRQASSPELNMPSVNLFIYDFLFALYIIIIISHELRNKLDINRKLILNITMPCSPMLIPYVHSTEDKRCFFLAELT